MIGRKDGRKATIPNLSEQTIEKEKALKGNLKYHALRHKIANIPNLWKAFKAVKRNKGVAGVDRVTIKEFGNNLVRNLLSIKKNLLEKEYKASAILRKYIPKGKYEKRPLGIPIVKDRVIQQAYRQVLEPIYEEDFHENSYGYRGGKGCKQAIEKVVEYWKEGYTEVVDADIKGFFDNINHELIMKLVRQKVSDGWVIRGIKAMLKAEIVEGEEKTKPERGTPQGGVLSPLLANIVLNELDWELHRRGIKFVRYADDFLCLTKTEKEAYEIKEFLGEFLKEKLDLELSEEKTTVTNFWKGFKFLGYHFHGNHLGIREKSLEKFKDTVRLYTKRSQNSSNRNIAEIIEDKLNPLIRGFANYFKLGENSKLYRYLDCWVRMRIRAMKNKRISRLDNIRIRNKRFLNWGLLSLSEIHKKHNAVLRYVCLPL